MSAFGGKADIAIKGHHVPLDPQRKALFDRLVGRVSNFAQMLPSLIIWNDRGHADVVPSHIHKIEQLRSV
jgi:hypothetical protein